ncbi:MAG: glycosyltransferase family 61 protein [Candidatus Thiodiazotropha sp. (ex Myrtea sp. 'scaly one' KF741663)]|nr:glycosyltransferase family 61 protein [Candidatus Thiodiazotropha sp. (ex Myrtea sp. 'scaly one' KF741663)]
MAGIILHIYRGFLSRFVVFRVARYAFVLLMRLLRHIKSTSNIFNSDYKRYQLVKFKSLSLEECLFSKVILRSRDYKTDSPKFTNKVNYNLDNTDSSFDVSAAEISVKLLNNVSILGGSFFVFLDKKVVLPEQCDFDKDTYSAEYLGLVTINRKKGEMKSTAVEKLDEYDLGVSMVGQNAFNYAHWMTEILPKLYILNKYTAFDDYPVFVDADLPDNMYESIHVLNKTNRDIIAVKKWEKVRIRNAVIISQPSYEPYIPDGIIIRRTSDTVNSFSKEVFREFSSHIQEVFSLNNRSEGKVYLTRNSGNNNLRRVENESEIINYLQSINFMIINGSSLSFSEQVEVCGSASIIVAPIGAALANMILAKKECLVIALAPFYQDAKYHYYSNLAQILGHKLFYVLGRQEISGYHLMHRSYSIDMKDLKKVIKMAIDCEL